MTVQKISDIIKIEQKWGERSMEYGVIVFISIVFLFIAYRCLKNSAQDRIDDEIKRYKEEKFKEEFEKQKREITLKISNETLDSVNRLQQLNKEIEQKKEFNSSLLEIREKELNSLIEEKRKVKEIQLNLEIDEWSKSAQEAASFNSHLLIEKYNDGIEDLTYKYNLLRSEIEDFRTKRETINQEILRARALEEKQDFYRVQLDPIAIKDIAVINSIKSSISKFDLLEKLLYDCYVKKSVDEMIKRVLEGRAPCGIYKITRLKTKEVYIGQSTDIKARWAQHAKSAFHCGTISHSTLHTTIERDGIENFTWELLEEVPKDKLRERERYWISFYQSKDYGLNEKL